MDVMEAIRNRRSIRRYHKNDVPEEKLIQVLEAGRWDPSAHNSQSRSFVVVKDRGPFGLHRYSADLGAGNPLTRVEGRHGIEVAKHFLSRLQMIRMTLRAEKVFRLPVPPISPASFPPEPGKDHGCRNGHQACRAPASYGHGSSRGMLKPLES